MDLTLLDDADLRRMFGVPTMTRARSYAQRGQTRLLELDREDDAVWLMGESDGSHGELYRGSIGVQDGPRGPLQHSSCSCPVSTGCKHVAAMLLLAITREEEARRAGPVGVPMWERRLEALLEELEADDVDGDGWHGEPLPPEPLALEVSRGPIATARQAYRWASDPAGPARGPLRIRPLQQSRRGRWVKQGAAWADLRRLRAQGAEPTHCDALETLQALYRAGLNTYYMTSETHLRLAAFGSGLWPALARAREVGVELVAGDGVRDVQLADPVSFEVDLTAEGSGESGRGGGSRVRLGVAVAGEWVPSGSLEIIGDPGHGLAAWAADGILLAPLVKPVGPQLARLLADDSPLVVPDADRDVLVHDYLPRLQRQVSVVSGDASAPVPAPARPVLVLTLDWKAADEVDVRWTWRYRDPGGPVTTDDGSEAGGELVYELDEQRGTTRGVRRPRLEASILAALDPGEDTVHRLYLERDRHQGPRARQTIRGYEAVGLVEDVLPELETRAAAGVLEIEELGDRPDYRAAEQPPEVRFTSPRGEHGDDPDDPDDEFVGGRRGKGDPQDPDYRPDWLGLEVVVTVEGYSIGLATVLEALTTGRTKVVLGKGLVVDLDVPALRRLAELVEAAGDLVEQPRDGIAVRRPDLGLFEELADLGIVEGQAARFVEAARGLTLPDQLPAVDVPDVDATLRSYQDEGLRWLAFLHHHRLGGLLADDMGLGKTLQTLALIAHARRTRPDDGPFLVVAPTSVLGTWAGEAARFTPHLDVRVVVGTQSRRGSTIAEVVEAHGGADVVVTSYTLLRLEADAYAARTWGGVVLDEAQAVKNHQGKTYQAVRRLETDFRLALTGTPVENRLMELWSLLSIVTPGLFPWPDRFRQAVADPVEKESDAEVLERFRRRVAPYLLRRTKDLVAADLPPKQEQVLSVRLGRAHQHLYDTHLQRERQHVLGLVDEGMDAHRIAIFRSLTRLRQLAIDPVLLDEEHEGVGAAKTDVLVDHLRDVVAEGHKALVFSQFTTYLRRVRERLDAAGLHTHYLDGATRRRGDVVEAFRDSGPSIFLISLKAGGTGLTLTEADYVFVLDPWWNPAVEAQAVDRAHRIGQDKPVMVYRLVSAGTIEEKVVELQARKAALAASVLDPAALQQTRDRAAGSSLGADEVRELLA
ncbi:DEAD/DEAH box helicase [Nocardioidaceae bacterium]|nr:DEAD/DEAH box helicase [Nocardioidaceae bacterium]